MILDEGRRVMIGFGVEPSQVRFVATSATIGKNDGESTRDEALSHAKIIVEATDLPVSADLVNGFVCLCPGGYTGPQCAIGE